MAGYWEGFTEKDINLYLRNGEEEGKKPVPKREARMGSQGTGRKRTARERKKSSEQDKTPGPGDASTPVPDSGRLLEKERAEDKPVEDEDAAAKAVDERRERRVPATMPTSNLLPVRLKLMSGNGYRLVETDSKNVSPATLQVFQARQKVLEEENKRRKEMLAKVLDDRRKQTTEEANRLERIRDELRKLDVTLSGDVGILRNQIESASIEFGEAQKRYEKAEKEYLEAKRALFTKSERKEMLTEHLCAIIEQNEVRKAQKLSELMEKLRISDADAKAQCGIMSPYCESALSDEKHKGEERVSSKESQVVA